MKSICIKTNNTKNINYLLKLLKNSNLQKTYYSINKFKHYNNLIIHYKDDNTDNFISTISELLSFLVIEDYEIRLLKRLILSNYFYFDTQERSTL